MIRLLLKHFLLLAMTSSLVWGSVFGQASDDNQKNDRIAQVTFVPPISSNGLRSPEISNRISFNILFGISGGVQGFELGGLHNTNKGNVNGFQAAGLGNVNIGTQAGFQAAGFYNVNTQFSRGMLAAGIANVVSDSTKGALFAGIANVSAKTSRSFQAAGIANVSAEGHHGVQIAGISNYSGPDGEGAQLAGIVNVNVGTLNRLQIGGIINIAIHNTIGTQIAGIANYTRNLNGFQLGLINVADTVERGVPLGLFSVVRHGGYYAFELEANDAFWINATYKMGVPKLYNIFTVGYNQQNDQEMWGVGLGLGTFLPFGKYCGLNFDLTATHINDDDWWTNELNLLNRLKMNLWFDLGPLQLFGGASINVYVTNLADSEAIPGGNLINQERIFYDETHGRTRTVIYPGFNFGIRF